MPIPCRTVEVQAVHVDALGRWRAHLLDALEVGRLGAVDNVVERPLVRLVFSHHLLLHRRQEAIRVEEQGERKGRRAARVEPAAVLVVAEDERREPEADGGKDPRELVARDRVGPELRNARIEERVQCLLQLVRHDDLTLDGELELLEDEARFADHLLQPLNLLVEEDVERYAQTAHLDDLGDVVILDIILREPVHELGGLGEHHVLAAHATATAAALGLRLAQRREERVHFLHAVSEVGVRVEAENLRRVDLREARDEGLVLLVLGEHRHCVLEVLRDREDWCGRVVRVALRARVRREPLLRVRDEHAAVEIVGDLAAVLHLGDHVLEGLPRDRAVVEVLLEEEDARGNVASVVLVRDAPAERAELTALLHDRVKEAQAEEELAPHGAIHALEAVLVDQHGVRAQDARLQAGWRLVRHLRRHLQQAERELGVRQGRDEKAEVGVETRLDELQDDLLHLVHELEHELAILQKDPRTLRRGRLHRLHGDHILALAKRDHSRPREFALARQALDAVGRIGATGEEENHRHLRSHLGENHLVRVGHRLDESRAELRRVAHELARAENGSVHPQRADEQELEERADLRLLGQTILVVGDRPRLRLVVLIPVVPDGLVRRHLGRQVREELVRLRELEHVEPCLVLQPREGLALDRVDVERGAATEQQRHVRRLE
mmetsp:Transcript_106269/g.307718  ORF Transcript_106269/g.307718 Transcript_106269/m.307718 type:complete len:669 (-) Transcript_106269:12010-14016(-)